MNRKNISENLLLTFILLEINSKIGTQYILDLLHYFLISVLYFNN